MQQAECSVVIIYLCSLPGSSPPDICDTRENEASNFVFLAKILPYLALLRMGFVRPGRCRFSLLKISAQRPAGGLLPRHFTLTPTS